MKEGLMEICHTCSYTFQPTHRQQKICADCRENRYAPPVPDTEEPEVEDMQEARG